jgi:hypothetical protein
VEEECEKQELNLRTPTGTDLESASVDHLDILAQNTIGCRIVKGFEFYRLVPEINDQFRR